MKAARVAAIARKEWREIVRDRLYFALAFLLPVLLMFVLGYGLTQDVEHIPLAVVDEDRSAASRDYARHFTDSRYFRFEGHVATVADAERLLAAGRVRVVIVIGDRFERDLLGGRTATSRRCSTARSSPPRGCCRAISTRSTPARGSSCRRWRWPDASA